MNGCMDGWMTVDEWMNGWVDGWMDGQMDGRMAGRLDGWMDGWMMMDGWMDGWLAGWMDDHVIRKKGESTHLNLIQPLRIFKKILLIVETTLPSYIM